MPVTTVDVLLPPPLTACRASSLRSWDYSPRLVTALSACISRSRLLQRRLGWFTGFYFGVVAESPSRGNSNCLRSAPTWTRDTCATDAVLGRPVTGIPLSATAWLPPPMYQRWRRYTSFQQRRSRRTTHEPQVWRACFLHRCSTSMEFITNRAEADVDHIHVQARSQDIPVRTTQRLCTWTRLVTVEWTFGRIV